MKRIFCFFNICLYVVICIVCINVSCRVYAEDLIENTSIFDLPIEQIMELSISLPSKKVEHLFDSPLSASVVTREELRSSGALSIPEALRLVPGVIVREQTAGVFDVHVRGFDTLPENSDFSNSSNSLTLVMIDNRIVYNYWQGGTFWETFPISIHDVERIEIIRGAAATLYGPNAVTGVINIITRRNRKKGWSMNANLEGGSFRTKTGHLAVTYNHEDTFSLGASANISERDRHQSSYYEFKSDSYLANVEDVVGYQSGQSLSNPDERYPDHHKSLDRYGVNGFIRINPNDDVEINFSSGYQDSRVQRIYYEVATPFTTQDSESAYCDLAARIRNLNLQFSFNDGDQELVRGDPSLKYDFRTYDFRAEYDLRLGKLSLLPGLWYQKVVYDGDLIMGRHNIVAGAASLRAEYPLTEKLRLIAALRYDDYNKPDDPYFSWQLAATYLFNENNIFRAVYSRAHRSPFFKTMHVDIQVSNVFVARGNDNPDLLIMDMFELGFRSNCFNNVMLDFEAFYAVARNYEDTVIVRQAFRPMEADFNNLDMRARQIGVTGSLTWQPGSRLSMSAFGTLQYTYLNDSAPDHADIENEEDVKHRATPALYGGMNVKYRPAENLILDMNAYYYTGQKLDNFEVQSDHIHGKIIINARVEYRLTEALSVFANARNLLNSAKREFAFADEIRGTYLIGFNLNF
ncbi:MAG: TonB-dependent receptor [Deltaproteobacteria bacterium]|nr:TonB-dependent receptor [Deltaproteobacteria bacterium]